MSNIKLVDSLNEVNFINGWSEATKFNSEDKFVDEKGKYVDATYAERKYRLVSKRERDYSFLQRGIRGFAAALILVCTLGLVYFSQTVWKSVKKLFFKQKETVRIGVLVTTPQTLPENIDLVKKKAEQVPIIDKAEQAPIINSVHKVKQFVPSLQDLLRRIPPKDKVPDITTTQDALSSPPRKPLEKIITTTDEADQILDFPTLQSTIQDATPTETDQILDTLTIQPTLQDTPPTEDVFVVIDADKNEVNEALETPPEQKTKQRKEEFKISKEEVQKGIAISKDTISEIQACMKLILARKEKDGIKFYSSRKDHRVFALENAPGLIFKMKVKNYVPKFSWDDSIKARYKKMINAQTVIRTHELGLLVVPKAKLFSVKADGKKYDIIAEEKLDITPLESVQEQYFDEYGASLNETIRQLALFICKTGYSDVEWRNNPIINNCVDEHGNRKIALIDIEESIEEKDCVNVGLFGVSRRRTGLVHLVNEEQGEIIEKVAKENGVEEIFIGEDPYVARKRVLDENRKLKEFYARKGIVKGDEQIQVDIDSLGLDLEESAKIRIVVKDENRKPIMDGQSYKYREKVITLRRVAEDLIQELNQLIQKKDAQESAKGKRDIFVNVTKGRMSAYTNLGLHEDEPVIAGEEKEKWLDLIIKALIEEGHIFKLISTSSRGYHIQA